MLRANLVAFNLLGVSLNRRGVDFECTMANLIAEFHEHLTCPGVKYGEETSICLLESDPKMSKSHANVVSFYENVSYLSNSVKLYEGKEHFFMNETAIELTEQTLHLTLKIFYLELSTLNRHRVKFKLKLCSSY